MIITTIMVTVIITEQRFEGRARTDS